MGTFGGANIAVDGLVFGYDTGYPLVSASHESYKFNKGEPTTNVLNDTILGVGNGASLGSDDFGKYIQLANQTTSYSRFQLPNITVSSDETYTWSFELYSEDTINQSGNTYYFDTNEYSDQFPSSNDQSRLSSSQDRPNTITTGEWTPFRLTVTMKPNLTGAYTYDFFNMTYPTFQNKKIYYRNMQFERNKDHKTPYVGQGGTRSVTESLIDLKRTTDIDLSNVSFNSNAQMIFDGTDDRIELGDQFDIADYFIDNQSFTIEAVVNLLNTDTNSNGGIFSNQKYQSQTDAPGFGLCIRRANNTLYYCMNIVEVDNSIQTSYEALAQVAANIGNLEHVTYVYDNNTSTIYAYINGELANSQTNSNFNWSLPTDTTRTKIGTSTQGGWGYYHEMNLPVVKCYNKALTSAEVQQNYNAYKNRFNL